ncbi:MAG TPA: glycosyltransferase [Gaiellaceae bacterium]|nr:glycosyltransferase [Gaiellaceae bacterium]
MSRVLFLAYHFPPIGGGGVQRNAKFVKYLPEFGVEALVLTGPGRAHGRWTPADQTLMRDIPSETKVHRVPGPVPAVRRGWHRRLERVFMLDEAFTRWWNDGAFDLGTRIGRNTDVVYVSLAPYRTAEAAARLAHELGKPWVADLQDPWALDEIWLYPTALHRRRDLRRMRRLLGTADAIIMNTPEAARRVRTAFPELAGKRVVSIPNGFDPDDFAAPPPDREDGAFRIAHTGYLYTDLGLRHRKTARMRRLAGGMFAPVDILTRSHVFLLEAIRRLIEADPSLASTVEVHLAGEFTEADRQVSRHFPFVKMHGYLEHEKSIGLLRSADLLFVPMQDLPAGMRASVIPGKVYEYLVSGRPILAAVPDGDARDLLDSAGTAILCRPADTDAMSEIVAEQVRRWRAGAPIPEPRPEILARYERRSLTEDLVEVLDATVRKRRVSVASPSPTERRRAAGEHRKARDPKGSERPEVSILLVSWNTHDFTLECLDSLPSGIDDDLTYELIVVDNGSRDGTAEALAEREDIELVSNPDNRGYAAAVNQAYSRSKGELVLLLNSDVRFTPGSVSTLVRFLREHEDVAGVVPLYLNPDGTRQAHYYRLPTFTMTLANANAVMRSLPPFSQRVREYRMLDDDFSQPRHVPQPSASCLLLRRSLLAPDHLMDERYPIYFNDVALARELTLRGGSLWMTPEAVIVHEHGASTRQLGGALKRQHLGSLVRYIAMTEPFPRLLLFRSLALAQGLAVRVLRRSDALPLGDLWSALRGDPGPLPQAPSSTEGERELVGTRG